MSQGARRLLLIPIAAGFAATWLVPAAGAGNGSGVATEVSNGHLGTGAAASQRVSTLTITGTTENDVVTVFTDSTGRLTITTSPRGITPPPGGGCSQDGPNQISCPPGAVQVITGDLGIGNDRVSVPDSTFVILGAVLDGVPTPVSGNVGNDNLLGGSAADRFSGGPGADTVGGAAGADSLFGNSGKDRLSGGPARDALFGGSDGDRLNGGNKRDVCIGAAGRDRAKACELLRKIP